MTYRNVPSKWRAGWGCGFKLTAKCLSPEQVRGFLQLLTVWREASFGKVHEARS